MKKIVNPKYESLSAWLDKLADAEYFESHGEVLHQGRNVIKRFQVDQTVVVVKRYGHFTAFNRVMYSTVRQSKAMRAYRYAERLGKLGISTPEEIAVVETFKGGLLQDTYFVSAHTSLPSLAFVRDFSSGRQEMYPVLDALSAWLVSLHDKGVCHNDLNVSNILYAQAPDGTFTFQLIDNNRMTFRPALSMNERLKDLSRLSTNFELYHYVLSRYVRLMGCTDNEDLLKGYFYKVMLECRQLGKRKMKQAFLM